MNDGCEAYEGPRDQRKTQRVLREPVIHLSGDPFLGSDSSWRGSDLRGVITFVSRSTPSWRSRSTAKGRLEWVDPTTSRAHWPAKSKSLESTAVGALIMLGTLFGLIALIFVLVLRQDPDARGPSKKQRADGV